MHGPSRCLSVGVALALGMLLATPAFGNDPVPRVRNEDLPVASIVAPYRRTQVTHVLVGSVPARQEGRAPQLRFRVAGVGPVLDYAGLVGLLRSRAGAERPSPHGVWITVHRDHPFAYVNVVRRACAEAGLYRCGLRVRHPHGGTYGFPLFLPARADVTEVDGEGLRLPLRVWDTANTEDRSDPRVLYQVVQKASAQFKLPVVAEIRPTNAVPAGDMVGILDALYRGGCRAVRLRTVKSWTPRPADTRPGSVVTILRPRGPNSELPAKPFQDVLLPVTPARTEPWPIHGANDPAAFRLELLELPGRDQKTPRRVADPGRVLPNHLTRGQVSPALRDRAREWIANWASDLSAALSRAARDWTTLDRMLVARLREATRKQIAVSGAFQGLRGMTRLRARTLSLYVVFLQGGRPVGHASVELLVGGKRVEILSAKPIEASVPAPGTVPPEAVDPFAAGVPGALRVWLEARLLDARAGRLTEVASLDRIVGGLPSTEATEASANEPVRQAALQAFTRFVRNLPMDRLLIVQAGGTAVGDNAQGLVGRMLFGLESEEKELRLHRFEAKRFR